MGGIIAGDSDAPHTHAGAIKKDQRLNLVGCVDKDPKHSQSFSLLHKCDVFNDLEFLHCQTCIVSVCTRFDSFLVASKVLESKHCPSVIFIEKPVCLFAGEFNTLKDLLSKKKVAIVVNHTRRFDPRIWHCKDLLMSGDIGNVFE